MDVCDPWADPAEVKSEYGIELVEPNQAYDAVILAVNHQEFMHKDLKPLIRENSVVFDVKGVLDRQMVDARL